MTMTAITAKSILKQAAEQKLTLSPEDRLKFYWATETNLGHARRTEDGAHLKFDDGTIVLHVGTDRELTIFDAPTHAYAESAAAVALKYGVA